MATPQAAPVSLNAVLSPEATAPLIDSTMAAALAEHLPAGESAAQTVNTPQLQQALTRFTEALHTGGAAGLIAELRINPSGLGVEPFLRALQAATPAQPAPAAAEPMDTSTDTAPSGDAAEKMEE